MTRTYRSLGLIAAGVAAIAALNVYVFNRPAPVVAQAATPQRIRNAGNRGGSARTRRAEIGVHSYWCRDGRTAVAVYSWMKATVRAGQVIAEIVNDDFQGARRISRGGPRGATGQNPARHERRARRSDVKQG